MSDVTDVEYSDFVVARVFSGDECVMFSTDRPIVSIENKRISFPNMKVLDCFQGIYLGTDFMIEIWEENKKEPTTYFYESGITNFGMIKVLPVEDSDRQVVIFDNMDFEYDWASDDQNRIPGMEEEIS